MKYSLAIYTSPYSSQGSETAYQFAKTALALGHEIDRVFFYMEGVHNATTLAVAPQDEADIPARWAALLKQHNIDTVICVAAALKRGLLDKTEAHRYEKPAHNMNPGYTLSGLGQLVEAGIVSDRLISFG